MSTFITLLLFALTLFLAYGFYWLYGRMKKARIIKSFEMELYAIALPKGMHKDSGSGGASASIKEEIGHTEQLFNALSSLREPFVLEAAVHHIGEEILFYMSVNGKVAEAVERQIQSIWPGAQVRRVSDYTVFNAHGESVGAYITETEHFALPIKTYAEMDADTFGPIVGGLSKLDELGEGAAIQILVRPAPTGSKKTIQEHILALKKGKPTKEVLKSGVDFSSLKASLIVKDKKNPAEREEKIIDDMAVKALEMKASKPIFDVNVRLVASGPTPAHADAILTGLTTGFSQFGAPFRNAFKAVKVRNIAKLTYQFAFREFDRGQTMSLNSEELASIFHLPISLNDIPRIHWLKAKEAAPPSNLPDKGVFIGESSFRGDMRPVFITDDDRRRHAYIVGQTGTGKSTLIYNMAINDIRDGKGVCIVDPNGDLVENLLQAMPKERVDDLILFDPGDVGRPLGLNMLEYDPAKPEQKTFIVNELMGIFERLFDMKTTGGPMFEQYARNALLLLMDDPNEQATLIDVPRVFTNPEFRARLTAKAKNPIVAEFWEKEASKVKGEYSIENTAPYFTSKFNNFIANDYVRPIIAQSKSVFDFRKVMDEGKILLVNLSKGKIGDINANLLGMIIVGKLQIAAFSRADTIDQEARRDFYLYIDEFQNFTTDSISTVLSEARKYRLNLTVAHQFIAQLTEKIRDAVFGNVGSIMSLRVGPQDADFLVKQFTPVFNETDLVNIDNLNAYVKLLMRGETAKPFNIKIPVNYLKNPELALKLKEINALQYGRNRAEIEAEIYARIRG